MGVAVVSLGIPKQGFLPAPEHESPSPPELLERVDHRSGRRAHLVAQYPPSPHEPDQEQGDTTLSGSIRQPQHHLHRIQRTPLPPPRPPDATTTAVPDVTETKLGTLVTTSRRHAQPRRPSDRADQIRGMPRPTTLPHLRPSPTTPVERATVVHHPQQTDLGRENPRSAATGLHGRPPRCPRSREGKAPPRFPGAAAPAPRLHRRAVQPQRARPCRPASSVRQAAPRRPASSSRQATPRRARALHPRRRAPPQPR